MGIHSRARPTIASLLVSYGNGYAKKKKLIIKSEFCKSVFKYLNSEAQKFEKNNYFKYKIFLKNF